MEYSLYILPEVAYMLSSQNDICRRIGLTDPSVVANTSGAIIVHAHEIEITMATTSGLC